jgi:endoglucanase
MEASGDGLVNATEWDVWLKWVSEQKISWIAWSISSKSETCSMIIADDRSGNKSAPISHWTDGDLKEWGKIVRAELRK